VHGTAAFAGGALVGTAGTAGLVVYRRNGKQDRVVDPELPRNHLMAMARDPSTGVIVASIDCTIGRAVSIVNLERDSARMHRTGRRLHAVRTFSPIAVAL
jgi:hypothetical protein